MDERIRVLIVEDNTALAENLFEFLGEDRYALDFAADGLTALHLAAANDYDVMVLDVMLPGLSGFTLCRRIREDLHCPTPIIFVTAKEHIDDKVSGFENGGDDYLVKPFQLRELALRIDALHRRRTVDDILHAGGIRFDPGTLKVHLEGHLALELSGIAARIFEAMMRAYPRMVTYEQLFERLWGSDHDTDMNTLRTHVHALRKRLKEAFGLSLIKTLRGRGYRLVPPGED